MNVLAVVEPPPTSGLSKGSEHPQGTRSTSTESEGSSPIPIAADQATSAISRASSAAPRVPPATLRSLSAGSRQSLTIPPGPLASSHSSPHSSRLEHAYVQPSQNAHCPTPSLPTPTRATYELEILGEPIVNPPEDITIFGEATGNLFIEYGIDIRYHAVLRILDAEVDPKDWRACILRLNLTRDDEAIDTAYENELADEIVSAMMEDLVTDDR